MNILLVTETYLPWLTGVAVSTDSIARYLVSQGHKVTIVCPKPLAKGEVTPLNGLAIVHVPALPFSFYNLSSTASFPSALTIIGRLLKKQKFDVIHIQEPGLTGIAALIEAKKYNVPIAGYLHFIPEQIDRVLWGSVEPVLTPIINIFVKFIYNKYDAVMTPSLFFAHYLKKIGVKKPITVVSNGTNVKKFHPGPRDYNLRKRLGFKNDETVFFFLGRLDGDKNVETLVKALPFTNPKIKLLIVGKGTQKTYLDGLETKLDVYEKIVWVNYITDEEMPDYYHAADVFSIMSPYEGQSIVTLQAVATGLPVIAANAGALPELCHDGKNGYLVGTYNHKALAEVMNKLAKNKTLREKFGKESRIISLEHDKPTALHKLEVIYHEIISDKSGKRKFRGHRENIF